MTKRNRQKLDSGFYTSSLDSVRQNFSKWSNKKIVAGSIPETLNEIAAKKIAFLHIDLNCSPPEVAAINALWEWIEKRGIVLLDDYVYHGYQPQKEEMDTLISSGYFDYQSTNSTGINHSLRHDSSRRRSSIVRQIAWNAA